MNIYLIVGRMLLPVKPDLAEEVEIPLCWFHTLPEALDCITALKTDPEQPWIDVTYQVIPEGTAKRTPVELATAL